MLSEAQVARFKQDGYVKGGKVLSDDEVEVLRAEVLRVIAERDRKDVPQPVMCHNMSRSETAPIWQIVNIWMASEPFRRLIANPTVCEEMAQLLAGDEVGDVNELRIWHDQIQYKPASGGGVNMWHQDSPYWGILTPKHQQVTAWIALDDVDEENGCMSMVPGSQHWGNNIQFLHTLKRFEDMPGEFEGRTVAVRTCPVRKGEVHFHHALCWHGSNANRSNRPRRAIALHFMTDQTRYDAKGNHVMGQFVEVADGEVMRGKAFPLVWERQRAAVG
jgi:ectoine hydroxylase-related dioxygenase (phytanoyl-CoA dioxygenase family)